MLYLDISCQWEMKVAAVTPMILTFRIEWFNLFWQLIKCTNKCLRLSWLSSFTFIEAWVLLAFNATLRSLKRRENALGICFFLFVYVFFNCASGKHFGINLSGSSSSLHLFSFLSINSYQLWLLFHNTENNKWSLAGTFRLIKYNNLITAMYPHSFFSLYLCSYWYAFKKKWNKLVELNWAKAISQSIQMADNSSIIPRLCDKQRNQGHTEALLLQHLGWCICIVWAVRDGMEDKDKKVSLLMCLGVISLSRIHAVSDRRWITEWRGAGDTGAALRGAHPETHWQCN